MEDVEKVLDDLNTIYGVVSIGRMKDLCAKAGVPYRGYSEARQLSRDLKAKGYYIDIEKQNVRFVAVGQTLILRKLDGSFVHGHQVWIDYQDEMGLKDKELFSEDDIVKFEAE